MQIESLHTEEPAKTADAIHEQAEEMPEEPAEATPPPVLPENLVKPSSFATEIPKEQSTDNGDLSFEPYHTIDYFASLGIKLKPEELAKDKLGQQLKSFTDWLRSMKKITPTQAGEKMSEVDELTDQSIQRIAEFSNEAKEIITEAMAEVWAKQGHKEKAVEIYQKLSLLNPSKSHYFAARIEALKA